MSKNRKKVNIVLTLTLLMVAFLSVIGVSFSYFTATSNKSGELNFSQLNVKFLYVDKNNETKDIPAAQGGGLGTLTLYPTVTTILKNESFELALYGEDDSIKSILIRNMENSCHAYVRFWIDAYVMDSEGELDTTNNYGKYFLLADSDVYTNTNSSVEGSTCYFVKNRLEAYDAESSTINLGNTLKMSDLENDEIPQTLLGNKLKVTISFEAVQCANLAFKSVFGGQDDTKGYYKDWS